MVMWTRLNVLTVIVSQFVPKQKCAQIGSYSAFSQSKKGMPYLEVIFFVGDLLLGRDIQ